MESDSDLNSKVGQDLRELLFPLDRPFELTIDPGYGVVCSEAGDDLQLVERIVAAYNKSQVLAEDADSFWSNNFGGRKKPIHDALVNADVATVASMLRDPAGNDLFYGFDHPCVTWWGPISVDEGGWHARGLYDRLVRLAEAVGAFRCYHPETPLSLQPPPRSLDEIFDAIDNSAGVKIEFPTPYEREAGVVTSRGLVTHRPVQSLFQAMLLKHSLKNVNGSTVVEIGAGLGRTAYYAFTLGIRDFTIVDLPITSVAQAYFLGRCIGPENIKLFGESGQAAISIIPPVAFFESKQRYDLCLNVDSITEMSINSAEKYVDAISRRSRRMISINHEANTFTSRDLYKCRPEWEVDRSPYWLRKGYVQETIRFPAYPAPGGSLEGQRNVWWPFRSRKTARGA